MSLRQRAIPLAIFGIVAASMVGGGLSRPPVLRLPQKGREKTGAREPTDSVKHAKVRGTMGLVTNNDEGPFAGTRDFAENKVDRATGTIGVCAVFPNADRRLTPGLFAKVHMPVSDTLGATVLGAFSHRSSPSSSAG